MYFTEFVGYTRSGKNASAELIKKMYPGLNIRVVDITSEVLLPEAIRRGLPLTRDQFRVLYMEMRTRAYEKVHQIALNDGADILLSPNCRLLATENYVRNLGYDYIRVGVEANEEIRLLRHIKDHKTSDPKIATIEELREIDRKDRDLTDMGKIISQKAFDVIINNNSNSLEQLECTLQEVIDPIFLPLTKVPV